MGMTLDELARIAGAELRGDPARVIERVSTLGGAVEGEISFLANPRYKNQLAGTGASAVVLSAENADDCPVDCLISDNPYLTHARVMTALHPPATAPVGTHGSAFVDPGARVSASASIGAQCFIGADVEIGDDVVVGPGCVVLEGSIIGAGSRLVASVTLCAGTQLGERCLIHPGAVIGSDGFGLANDEGAWTKVPQIGRAILGNDVEVGSCTSVDRGAIGDTVLNDGVKLDSQVHIAHNVQVGVHTAIAGCTGIAGSTTIGAYSTLAGGVGVTGHVELADHVHVSGATAVTRSIKKAGLYTGTFPAMEHASWSKNFARLRRLDEMARRLKTLEREMAELQAVPDDTRG